MKDEVWTTLEVFDTKKEAREFVSLQDERLDGYAHRYNAVEKTLWETLKGKTTDWKVSSRKLDLKEPIQTLCDLWQSKPEMFSVKVDTTLTPIKLKSGWVYFGDCEVFAFSESPHEFSSRNRTTIVSSGINLNRDEHGYLGDLLYGLLQAKEEQEDKAARDKLLSSIQEQTNHA